ncbi:MAG: hypothetical protein IJR49_06170, partial [Treponema sp.]|nr:hypothetical protein [Treponema sp.]
TYSLVFEYKTGHERTGKIFDSFVYSAKKAVESSSSTQGEQFRQLLEKSCGTLEDYESILLSENNIDIYAYPSRESAKNLNLSSFVKKYTASFSAREKDYSLSATLYLLKPQSIFYRARSVFTVILFATAVAGLLLIYLYVSGKPVKNIDVIPKEEYEEAAQNAVTHTNAVESFSQNTNSKNENQSSVGQNSLYGLFSPISGLCFEQYLLQRLDSELIRAASSENDLSLILIRIPTLHLHGALGKEICKNISTRYQLKDLLFEYKEDGIALIKECTTAEAIDFVDDIYADIEKLTNGTRLNCIIGISSRNFRMLSGDRLLKESEEALQHSSEDKDSPITAFNADIEKYRKFIEAEDANA